MFGEGLNVCLVQDFCVTGKSSLFKVRNLYVYLVVPEHKITGRCSVNNTPHCEDVRVSYPDLQTFRSMDHKGRNYWLQ
jgi:hypothetical protein